MKLNQFLMLTSDEKSLFAALSNINGNGVWQEAIRNQILEGSAEGFRHLIESLQSQASDSPLVMKDIIGAEAYQLLMRLEGAMTVDIGPVL